MFWVLMWRTTPYVKGCSMKSAKICDQTVCLMIVFISKSYLKPHKMKIKGSSEMVKSKILH